MIKREELTNPASCMSRARWDEMTFVVLERDVAAPGTIRDWAKRRIRMGKNKPDDRQITEALDAANYIEMTQVSESEYKPIPYPVALPPDLHIEMLERELAEARAARDDSQVQLARAVEALRAYLFVEQTNAGRNPHKPDTNRHRAFELGHAVLADPSTTATAEWLRRKLWEAWEDGRQAETSHACSYGLIKLPNPYAAGAPAEAKS